MVMRKGKFQGSVGMYKQLLIAIRLCGIGDQDSFRRVLRETGYHGPSLQIEQSQTNLPGSDTNQGMLHTRQKTLAHEQICAHGISEGISGADGKTLENCGLVEEKSTVGEITGVSESKKLEGNVDDHRNELLAKESGPKSSSVEFKNSIMKSSTEDPEWWQVTERKGRSSGDLSLEVELDALAPHSDIFIDGNYPDLLNPMENLSDVVEIHFIGTAIDRCNLLGGVKGLLIRMERDGVKPEIGICGQLLDLCPDTEDAEVALMQYMNTHGVMPDLEFLNRLMRKRLDRKDYGLVKVGVMMKVVIQTGLLG